MYVCCVCVCVFNFQPIAGSLSYVWERGCLLETAAVDLAYMDREAVRNASRRYAEPRQWGSAGGGTGISHRIKVSAPVISQPPGGDDDDVILPPPHLPSSHRRTPAVISPWAISGEYGIGDD